VTISPEFAKTRHVAAIPLVELLLSPDVQVAAIPLVELLLSPDVQVAAISFAELLLSPDVQIAFLPEIIAFASTCTPDESLWTEIFAEGHRPTLQEVVKGQEPRRMGDLKILTKLAFN
jgi:hypothetical protein